MIAIILTAIATFIATGIDEIVVLTILFVHYKESHSVKDIYIGQLISMVVLLSVSLLAVFGIATIPKEWIGLLGFVPLVLGVRVLLTGDTESDDEYEEKDLIKKTKKYNNLILAVAIIAIASGAEELSIYIPYLASLNTKDLITTLITFILLVPIWCAVCKRLSSVKGIQERIGKFERIIVPIVFIGLGIFVLIENNTLGYFIKLFY